MWRWLNAMVLLLGLGLLVAAPVRAHHAFSAAFDANRPVTLRGVVTKLELVNPHTWIHVDVEKPDGTVESWMIEAGTPNALLRRGITKSTLIVGTEVIVDGFQSKDGSLRANGRDITLPSGEKLFLGSTGDGSPDGR